MIHLYVWLRTSRGDTRRVGEIRVADPDQTRGGYLRGEFRYDAGYLDQDDAFALDPLHLPLGAQIFAAQRPQSGIHGVFEDSLPDAWGRGVIIRRFRLPRGQLSPPHLLAALSTDCLGALVYTRTPDVPSSADSPAPHDLPALIAAAAHYDENPQDVTDEELAMLFHAASSPGGARPKVTIEHDQVHWIGKLPSSRDTVDMVSVEAACLALARNAGLGVPAFQVETLGRRKVLLVKRFDIAPPWGRRHVASMQTLVGAEGYYLLGYADMADTVRRVSARPEEDLPMLYRQAVFNAFLGNTDDHLKNFAMLRNDFGWRLTPAYDLTPDIPLRGEHVLHFGSPGERPTRSDVQQLAKSFGLSAPKSRRIVSGIAAAFQRWEEVFSAQGVPQKDIRRLSKDIEQRRVQLGV